MVRRRLLSCFVRRSAADSPCSAPSLPPDRCRHLLDLFYSPGCLDGRLQPQDSAKGEVDETWNSLLRLRRANATTSLPSFAGRFVASLSSPSP